MSAADTASPASPGRKPPARAGIAWRLASAAVGIPLVLALIVVGDPWYSLVVALILAVGYLEFAAAVGLGWSPLAVTGAVAVAALAAAVHRGGGLTLAVLSASVAASLTIMVLRGETVGQLRLWGLSLAGVLYLGLLGQHFVRLRLLPDGRDWVLFAVFATFATDTGAYAVGRAFGRHRLASRVSPGKTVEGALGGLAAGSLAALALNAVLGLNRAPAAMLALGSAAALAAQLGDLAESFIKRSADVKDMGGIVPGHGGALDRLDSLLFVVPLIYYVVRYWPAR